MRVRRMGLVSLKARNQALRLFKYIENNDNADWHRNGEQAFLHSFLRTRRVEKPLVIFDCGAHHGHWATCCLEEVQNLGYSLHLFEPSRLSFEKVSARFSNNSHTRVNNVGVSDVETERKLYSDEQGSSLSSLYKRRISETQLFTREETVRLIRLDSYVKQHEIDHIDFLKLDVEGHELPALSGLGSFLNPSAISAIQFEYGGANIDSGSKLCDLYAVLSDRGFQICKIMRNHIEPREYSAVMENFMYANYVAISRTLLT